jgi:hypothetical protein
LDGGIGGLAAMQSASSEVKAEHRRRIQSHVLSGSEAERRQVHGSKPLMRSASTTVNQNNLN